MFRTAYLVAAALLVAHPAAATWSVLAIDSSAGTMVIASATCLTQRTFASMGARDLRDVQAIVVPGRGIAVAQAQVDTTRANQQLIFDELLAGTPPDQILERLRATDPLFERRQFGILDLQGRAAGFSGRSNLPTSLDRQGRLAGTDTWYSIQGNILVREAVVTEAIRAFTDARGTLADRVMAAMDAADAQGGDVRCSCDRGPRLEAPCTAKTSHVAYLLQAERTDPVPEKYNDGAFPLYISVTDENITRREDANPVRTLRMRYDVWRKGRTALRGRWNGLSDQPGPPGLARLTRESSPNAVHATPPAGRRRDALPTARFIALPAAHSHPVGVGAFRARPSAVMNEYDATKRHAYQARRP